MATGRPLTQTLSRCSNINFPSVSQDKSRSRSSRDCTLTSSSGPAASVKRTAIARGPSTRANWAVLWPISGSIWILPRSSSLCESTVRIILVCPRARACAAVTPFTTITSATTSNTNSSSNASDCLRCSRCDGDNDRTNADRCMDLLSLPGTPGSGQGITFDVFVRACVAIKSLTEGFQHFDPQRRGVAELSYKDFLETCTFLFFSFSFPVSLPPFSRNLLRVSCHYEVYRAPFARTYGCIFMKTFEIMCTSGLFSDTILFSSPCPLVSGAVPSRFSCIGGWEHASCLFAKLSPCTGQRCIAACYGCECYVSTGLKAP